jgi:hypothetical protein
VTFPELLQALSAAKSQGALEEEHKEDFSIVAKMSRLNAIAPPHDVCEANSA